MWQKLEISHKETIEKYTKGRFETCDYIFSNLLLWSIGDRIEFLEEDNILYLRGSYLKRETYFLPIPLEYENPNYFIGVEQLLSMGKEVELIPEELYETLQSKYTLEETRDSFDYIYLTEDLAYLKGRKYTKKRNKVNQFTKSYSYRFEDISENNIESIKKFQSEWYIKRSFNDNGELKKESEGLEVFLDNFSYLGLSGGAIFIDKNVVAYTIIEKSTDDTVIVLVEKADDDYNGSYQSINSIYLQETSLKSKYVNREDDAGEDGLRQAKMSYYPLKLLKKYKISKK